MFSAFAEFEKSRITERTKEGLERAKKEGKKLGRPIATDTRQRVQEAKTGGLSRSQGCCCFRFRDCHDKTSLEHLILLY